MTMPTLLTITSVYALALLCLSVAASKGIPVSISSVYYAVGRHGRLFQAAMAVMAVLLYAVWFPRSCAPHQWMVFLSCASLLFVAAAPGFKATPDGPVHYSAAVVCCVCAVLWQVLEGLWTVPLCAAITAALLSFAMRDKWCWWLECAVIASLLINIWLNL